MYGVCDALRPKSGFMATMTWCMRMEAWKPRVWPHGKRITDSVKLGIFQPETLFFRLSFL